MRSRWQRGISARKFRVIRKQALVEAGYKCRRCGGRRGLEADHIKPLFEGGHKYAIWNIQILCRECHQEKTALETGYVPDPEREELKDLVAELLD